MRELLFYKAMQKLNYSYLGLYQIFALYSVWSQIVGQTVYSYLAE